MGRHTSMRPGLNRAGGNWTGKRRDNLHTPNPGYPKKHWVECQRCGFDFREDGVFKEWTGAIVCGACLDFRQPQDFVRGRIDDTAPRGLVNAASDYDATPIVGSTTTAQGTFIDADVTVGTIADQSNETTDVVSLDAATGIWPTLYDVWAGADDVVVSYSSLNLPAGLSINSSTGTISGTITLGSEDDSPYSSNVEVTYGSGRTLDISFAWTVTQGLSSPDTIPGLIDYGWWDFSTAGVVGQVGGTWQDVARSVPCVQGAPMLVCDDKSGGDNHAVLATSLCTWSASGLNNYGVGVFTNGSGWLDCPEVAADAAGWSVVIVLRLHNQVGGTPQSRGALSALAASDTSTWMLWSGGTLAADRKYRIADTAGSVTYASSNTLWANVVDNYVYFYFETNQTTSSIYVNNVQHNPGTGVAWPDTKGPGKIEIGTAPTVGSWVGRIMEVVCMDKVLSAAERTALYNYHNTRYDLVGQ